jgi:hypothetical protein
VRSPNRHRVARTSAGQRRQKFASLTTDASGRTRSAPPPRHRPHQASPTRPRLPFRATHFRAPTQATPRKQRQARPHSMMRHVGRRGSGRPAVARPICQRST